MADFASTTEAQCDALFAVHVKGVFFLTQALLPLLADGGRIVNFPAHVGRRIAHDDRYVVAAGFFSADGQYRHGRLGFRQRDVVGDVVHGDGIELAVSALHRRTQLDQRAVGAAQVRHHLAPRFGGRGA